MTRCPGGAIEETYPASRYTVLQRHASASLTHRIPQPIKMKIEASSLSPPHDYARSSILRRPKGNITFDYVVRNVQRFNRESMLVMGSGLSWLTFRTPALLQAHAPGYRDHQLLMAYCDAMMVLACMHCRTKGRATVTELEYRLLCWELHLCEDYALARSTGGQAQIAATIPKYEEILTTVPSDSPLRNVPPHGLAYAHMASVLGTMVGQQWYTYSRGPTDRIRACLLYEGMIELSSDAAALRVRERAYFRTTYDRFLLCVQALIDLTNRDPKAGAYPGFLRFDYHAEASDADVIASVSFGDLSVVAEVLAADIDLFRTAARDLDARPQWQRSHAPELRALTRWPILREKAPEGERRLVVLSPQTLFTAAADRISFGFPEFLQSNSFAEDPYGLRGRAFEQYIRKAIQPAHAFIDVDEIPKLTGRKPDLVWLGKDFGIVIEIKFGLSPNTERYHLSSRALLESWVRAAGAVEQAEEFLRAHIARIVTPDQCPTRWIVLIVTYENLVRETTWFHLAAKRWRFLAQTRFESVHMLSSEEFEQFAIHASADECGRVLANYWEAIDPDSLSQPTLESPQGPPPLLIQEAWDRLLPTHSPP